jgi:hypothetical protein
LMHRGWWCFGEGSAVLLDEVWIAPTFNRLSKGQTAGLIRHFRSPQLFVPSNTGLGQ